MKKDHHNKENECLSDKASEVTLGINVPKAKASRFKIPAGLPQSVDEALADIEEGEQEFERKETFSHREVMQMIWDKIGSYAG